MKRGFDYGSLKAGEKPPADSDDEDGAEGKDGGKKKPSSFGDAGAGVAMKSLVAALGIDPEGVDMAKATKAMKALVSSCHGEDDDTESDEE